MGKFLSVLKKTLKSQSNLVAKFLGIKLLDWNTTKKVLGKYTINYEEEKEYILPVVFDIVDGEKIIFPEKKITTSETYVWRYNTKDNGNNILVNGSLSINNSILDTDFGNAIVLKDSLKINRRKTQSAKLVIAPWSHYWSGYYDYVVFVIAKLVRMKQATSDKDWNDALVAYPMMHTAFEKELLALVGLRPEQVVDSRVTKVHFEACLLGNNGSWFFPSSTDILSLKKTFQNKLKPKETANKRVYISRSGRRQINDEAALIDVLKKYNFTIIEDKPRTVAEQAEIYHNASVIIGPHGASFANILWCNPGTHLIELFPAHYMPEYFRYLAHVLSLKYSAYCFHPILTHGLIEHSFVDENVDVKVEDIDRFLLSLL